MDNFVKTLPLTPGIYLFYDDNNVLIYVGKATTLRDRVKSYFAKQKSPRPIEAFINEVKNIKWITTDSVLEAVILEANYIKKYQPKYNVLGKDDKSWNYLALTKTDFPSLIAIRQQEYKQLSSTDKKKYLKIFGPFPGLNTAAALKILRKLFNYSTCTPEQPKACFYYQIEQCLGVCVGEITKAEYKEKVIRPLVLFFEGKRTQLLANLSKQMTNAAKEQNFEEAERLRDQIRNLQKIQDVTLINKNFFNDNFAHLREPQCDKINIIEGYDISNLGATDVVGSLVTFLDGQPNKNKYRKFKIRSFEGQSDVDALKEVLSRRLKHSEWLLPNLFLIDGGKPQINAVRKILCESKINIPVVGIVKGVKRKRNDFLVPRDKKLTFWVKHNQKLLIQVRDEAHRFAIKYNRELRKKIITIKSKEYLP